MYVRGAWEVDRSGVVRCSGGRLECAPAPLRTGVVGVAIW
jgi:hypothetical protein